MPKTDGITQERLKELLHYDPLTGLFTRLQRTSNSVHIGDVAGSKNIISGYIIIRLDGVQHRAHRLAFLYMLGWIPIDGDHDNQIRHDNRWVNLNLATSTENNRNHSLHRDNTSGTCGVYWHRRDKTWQALIRVNKELIYLGQFTHKADAIAARKAAEIKYGFHVNHGKLSI